MIRIAFAALTAAVVLGAGLGTQRTGLIRHDRADSLYIAAAHRPQFASVGKVVGAAAGTGEVISAHWVLTAAHVVTRRDNGPTTLIPADSIGFEIGGRTIRVRRVVVNPDYWPAGLPATADALLRKGLDAALMELADAAPVTPARIDSGLPVRGMLGWYVGFGASGDGSTFFDRQVPAGTERAGTNQIDSLGAVLDGRHIPDFYLVSDFDGPGRPAYNRTGSAEPTDLEIQGAGGDSGGGVFVESGGAWWLVGIYVTGTFDPDAPKEQGAYGSLSYSVRVARIASWIASVAGADLPH